MQIKSSVVELFNKIKRNLANIKKKLKEKIQDFFRWKIQ